VRALGEAASPLPCREVAARCGIQPWAANYLLDKAVERFVEKIGGLYRVTAVVPVFAFRRGLCCVKIAPR